MEHHLQIRSAGGLLPLQALLLHQMLCLQEKQNGFDEAIWILVARLGMEAKAPMTTRMLSMQLQTCMVQT